MKYYLIATPFFPTEKQPQFGNFIYDQAEAIAKQSGMEVIVFMGGNASQEGYTFRGIRVEYFDFKATPSYLFNGFYNRHNARAFAEKVDSLGIDINNIYAVHGHTSTYGACGLLLKQHNRAIKTIVQHHDLDPLMIRNGLFAGNPINLWYRVRKSRQITQSEDLNVFISKASLRNLVDFPNATTRASFRQYRRREQLAKILNMPHISPKHCFVLHNGISTEKFHKLPTQASNGIFKIGIIANYIDLKRHDILAQAIRQLIDKGYDNLRLLTVGTNPVEGFSKFQSLVKELGIEAHVEYLPAIAHDRLCEFYNSLDLFVLPSIFEGFGCVYTEAYACGTPFIGCLGQGIEDLIPAEEKHLWLAKPDDASDLADKIEHFILNRPQQHLCGEIAIQPLIANFLSQLNKI